jgi:hypothetical protein
MATASLADGLVDGLADGQADDDAEDKVWGMPKYDHNHLENLTDEEYLAAVSTHGFINSPQPGGGGQHLTPESGGQF